MDEMKSNSAREDSDPDPEYRIAYDVDRCKVGCVLIQAALGCDVPRALFFDYFGTGAAWTVNARDCKIYPIRKSQLRLLAARTNFDREGP
jgi:hypothetical protein